MLSLTEPVAALSGSLLVLIGVAFASRKINAPSRPQGRPSGAASPQPAGRPA